MQTLGPRLGLGLSLALAGIACFAGCASVPVPTQRIASAQGAIRAAQENGASDNPTAAYHLKLAQEQFDEATNLVDEGDHKNAMYLLARAETDAQLSLALAREDSLKRQARALLDRVNAEQNNQQAPELPLDQATPPNASSTGGGSTL